MNRRQFLYSAAAGAALLKQPASVLAQETRLDLVIKGGRVIDPSLRIDSVRDIGIAGGRIVAVETSVATGTAAVIDADRKSVV